MKIKTQVLENLFKINLKICSEVSLCQAVTLPLTAKQSLFPYSNLSLLSMKLKTNFCSVPSPLYSVPRRWWSCSSYIWRHDEWCKGRGAPRECAAAKRRDVRTLVGCHNEDAPLGAWQQRLTISHVNGRHEGSHLEAHETRTLIRCNGYTVKPIHYTALGAIQFKIL